MVCSIYIAGLADPMLLITIKVTPFANIRVSLAWSISKCICTCLRQWVVSYLVKVIQFEKTYKLHTLEYLLFYNVTKSCMYSFDLPTIF